MFDINNDGRLEKLGWTDPVFDVGFLAFDRNGNGVVDGGHELFGNATPQGLATASDGFDALVELETPAYGFSVQDGVIDAQDAAFAQLLIWVDRNHDGISQQSELQPASSHGLVAIETTYRKSRRQDQHGNEYRLRGISWWSKSPSSSQREARFLYDVWLAESTRTTKHH
jgi:hypothetical protein